jgi:hypothetical protein
MARRNPLPPATLGKPSGKSKYSEEEDDEEECGCDGHDGNEIMLKISILLPDSLQRKG